VAVLDPAATTVGDLCTAALRESGALGVGQTALADDLNDAWARLQWMLQQWERKRWLVFHLVDLPKVSTGALSYTVGPAGDFSTGTTANSVRPARLESAFVRQIQNAAPNQVDWPLTVLQSREDYNRIALKSLVSFPSYVWLDTDWPQGRLYVWPTPSSAIYEIHISVLAQLPPRLPLITTVFNLPYEYYSAILYNLALRLRPKYRLPTFPGDSLPGLAKDSLNVLRGANLQIAQLVTPRGLIGGGRYNILSDQVS
jgi:hypothetical protein